MQIVNKKQLNYLREVAGRDRLVEAYLFCGPPKTGKAEAAFDLVAKVNQKTDIESLRKGVDPDIITVAPVVEEKSGKKRKKDISIEQIKIAVKKLGYYAYNSKYKFLIVQDCDKMTVAAANSLLKVIEDSTPDTIMILLGNNETQILPTIRSRCQIIRFGLAKTEDIVSQLQYENPAHSEKELSRAAELSRGAIVRARECLQDQNNFQEVQVALDGFKKALKAGVLEGLNLSEKLYQDKEQLKAFLDEAIWYLRDLLKQQIQKSSDIRVIRKIFTILQELVTLRAEVASSNINQRLQLENFFVQL